MKMAESSPNGQKTLWEMEKLLATSNFPFSQSVFIRLVLQTRKKQGLFGKRFKLQNLAKAKSVMTLVSQTSVLLFFPRKTQKFTQLRSGFQTSVRGR